MATRESSHRHGTQLVAVDYQELPEIVTAAPRGKIAALIMACRQLFKSGRIAIVRDFPLRLASVVERRRIDLDPPPPIRRR
jgi:hypothetical protein